LQAASFRAPAQDRGKQNSAAENSLDSFEFLRCDEQQGQPHAALLH